MREWQRPTEIECPRCDAAIPDRPNASVLDSVRCSGCGELLSFDEAIALRSAARARILKYE